MDKQAMIRFANILPAHGRQVVYCLLVFCLAMTCSCSAISGIGDRAVPSGRNATTQVQIPGNNSRGVPGMPVFDPSQITARVNPVQGFALSKDGSRLALVSTKRDFSTIWMQSGDPNQVQLPTKLVHTGGDQFQPAFFPDGQGLAYVGTGHDVKGDIYLANTGESRSSGKRLTGRKTADRAPSISPEGEKIYFHRSHPGNSTREIAVLDIDHPEEDARVLEIPRDAAYPEISPGGDKCVFVSATAENQSIFLLDLRDSSLHRLTSGDFRDSSPTWSPDGEFVYFTRCPESGECSIWRVPVLKGKKDPIPVTSGDFSAKHPRVSGERLYFVSSKSGVANIWYLPAQGRIPERKTAELQMQLAEDIEQSYPPNLHLAALAYLKVSSRFSDDDIIAANASLRAAKLYRRVGRKRYAESIYRTYSGKEKVMPQSGRAAIQLQVMRTRQKWQSRVTSRAKRRILKKAQAKLRFISDRYREFSGVVQLSRLERANLLLDLGGSSGDLLQALDVLEKVQQAKKAGAKARALFLKAEIFEAVGRRAEVIPMYARVLEECPRVRPWSNRAIERILDFKLSGVKEQARKKRLKTLRKVAEDYRSRIPGLAMGAVNRIGDIYFNSRKWSRAKTAYRRVLEEFKAGKSRQYSAARLSLAEILYKQERFLEAIELYKKEMADRAYQDYLYRLARSGYVKKNLQAARHHLDLGEVSRAKNMFFELLRWDSSLVRAHRGYIKCSAAQERISATLRAYQRKLAQNPRDPVIVYSTALCLTYRENEQSLHRAKSLIHKAIGMQGQVEFYHQTLGYIYEVLETVYDRQDKLELALREYRKAFFLNSGEQNPRNRANLLLNMGNVCFLLGRHQQAFEHYKRREESGAPFRKKDTELLFYHRFARAAFLTEKREKPIQALDKALGLIDNRLEPKKASSILGRMNSHIKEKILLPARKDDSIRENVHKLFERQSNIQSELFRASRRDVAPPPSSDWDKYKSSVQEIVEKQRKLVPDLKPLAQELPRVKWGSTKQDLLFMLDKADKALDFPMRLRQLQAQMLDRMGLAYQENRQWVKAREKFLQAFDLNKKLGNTRNLAPNRRSAGYNAYRQAGKARGKQGRKLLRLALQDFRRAIELVDKYGVPSRKKQEQGKGLINISLDVALDEQTATRAQYGFGPQQEKRLARAFIGRINIELGRLQPARETVEKQLLAYPPEKQVEDKDSFGVSLLLHRSAHLEIASGSPETAFQSFVRSAGLALEMGNPVSSAINAGNAAHALSRSYPGDKNASNKLDRLLGLENKVSKLLAEKKSYVDPLFRAGYKNRMGVALCSVARDISSRDIQSAVKSASVFSRAVAHFYQGLQALQQEDNPDRKNLSLQAAVHINLADLANSKGDVSTSRKHFQKALDISRKYLLDRFRWRALAGLNKYRRALDVLSGVALFERGCGHREVLHRLSPLVYGPAERNQPSKAFNTLEELSELQRVNSMAPLALSGLSSAKLGEVREFRKRIMEIKGLEKRLESSDKKDRDYLEQRLQQEKALLEEDLAQGEVFPRALLQGFRNKRRRNIFLELAGLSARKIQLGRVVAENPDNAKGEQAREKYHKVQDEYLHTLDLASSLLDSREPAGILGVFVAAPARAADLAAVLPAEKSALRLFRSPGRPWLAMRLSSSKLEILDRDVNMQSFSTKSRVVMFEHPQAVYKDLNQALALSGTHLLRCLDNKKPFKHKVLAYPGFPELSADFEIMDLQGDVRAEQIAAASERAHTFLANASVGRFSSVPTRRGELPRDSLGMHLKQGGYMDLLGFAGKLDNVSLAILNRSEMKDVYNLGHLFSLFGVPTTLFSGELPVSSLGMQQFFDHYSRDSVVRARKQLSRNNATAGEFSLQLGYWGMEEQQASALAKSNFRKYVQNGRRAYAKQNYTRAQAMFENALLVLDQVQIYQRYRSRLLEYARESAFAAGNLQKASQYAGDLSEYLEAKDEDSASLADALLKQGLVLSRLEEFDTAIDCLQRAADMYSELQLSQKRTQALSDLATVLENATQYDRALQGYRSAASLSEEMGARELRASQFMNIGRIYDLRLSRYAMAKEYYSRARRTYRELGKSRQVLQARLDIARCNRLLGRFESAAGTLSEILERARSLPNAERLQTKIVLEQANSAWFQSRYQEAFNLLQDALTRARKKDWVLEQVIALNTSGLTWWSMGRNERALRELNKALELAKTLEIRRDEVASTYNNIGLVLRDQEKFDRALNMLNKALDIDREIDSSWAMAYDLRNIGLTHVHRGRPEKAVSMLKQALGLTQDTGNEINRAKVLLALGNCYLKLGKLDRAKGYFLESLELSREMALGETVWRSRNGLGQIYKRKKRLPKAREHFLQAVNTIENIRSRIQITQLRNSFVADKMQVYESLVSVLLDMGRRAEAFYTAERSRARNMMDLLANHKLRLGKGRDKDIFNRINSLKAQILEQEKLVAQTEDQAESRKYKKTLNSLRDKYKDQLFRLQSQKPELKSLISVDPLSVGEVQKLLDPGVTLLSYYLLPGEIVCWVLGSEQFHVVRVPVERFQLRETILEFRRQLQNLEPYEASSEQLSSLLLKPVAKHLQGSDYVGIVPHRMLHYLSFAPLEYRDSQLVEKYPLFYLQSASLLRYTLKRRRRDKTDQVLAVGNPELDNPDMQLPFAEHEVEAMGWNFSRMRKLMRENATETRVSDDMQRFDIVHLASHGSFDPQNPLYSSLTLADGRGDDGELRATEVFGLEIKADLVVLSACQSGLGDIRAGDEVLGLNRAFLFAGTHALISSLWRVSDISTAVLMKQFYREYTRSNKAKSLRRAMLHTKTYYPHPGYWAGFILSGDYL